MKQQTAAVYARQSREQKSKSNGTGPNVSAFGAESISIKQQIDDGKQLAKERGLLLTEAHIYVDQNISGKLYPKCWETKRKAKTRPGFDALIHAIERGEINVIIVRKRDRLARNLTLALRFYEFLSEHKVGLICTHEHFQAGNDSTGKALVNILAVMAQLQRDQSSDQIRAAKRWQKENGMMICGCYLPGFINVKPGEVAVHNEDAEVVREMFRRFVAGGSIASLEHWLNKEHRAVLERTRRRKQKWYFTSIKRLLQNKKYIGLRDDGKGKSKVFAEIVDPQLFWRAQEIIKAREGTHKTLVRKPHVLSGFIRCGYCGKPMQPCGWDAKRPGLVFYACRYYDAPHPAGRPFLVQEQYWLDFIKKFYLFSVRVKTVESADAPIIRSQLAQLDDTIGELREQVLSKVLPADEFALLRKDAAERKAKLEEQLSALPRTTQRSIIPWEKMNDDDKREHIGGMIDRVEVFRRHCVVTQTEGKPQKFPLMKQRLPNSVNPVNVLMPVKDFLLGEVGEELIAMDDTGKAFDWGRWVNEDFYCAREKALVSRSEFPEKNAFKVEWNRRRRAELAGR